jgi:hypothetical protein
MPNESKKTNETPKLDEMPAALPAAKVSETGSPLRRALEGYERYALTVQTVFADAERRLQEAVQKLLQEETQDEQAQQRFLQEQQDTYLEAQRRYEEAYRGYLDGLREAWSQGDVSGLDAGSLLTIGQSVQAAAALAQSTMGSWCVVGHWVTQPLAGLRRAA